MAALNSTGKLENPGNGGAANVSGMCVCVHDVFQFLFRRFFFVSSALLEEEPKQGCLSGRSQCLAVGVATELGKT